MFVTSVNNLFCAVSIDKRIIKRVLLGYYSIEFVNQLKLDFSVICSNFVSVEVKKVFDQVIEIKIKRVGLQSFSN